MPRPERAATTEREPWEPFEPDYYQAVDQAFFGAIVDEYFRGELHGAAHLPAKGPVILAANHSGTAFPYDAMVLDVLLWRHEAMDPARKIRTVYEKELTMTWWMRPFGIDNFWRRGGGVDLTFDNFDRLLARGDRLLYFPEGVPGIGKGFQKRYQLQRFSTSFIIMAARHDAPVVPVHIVNAEWVIPFNFTLRPIDALVERLLKVPFLPLPAAPLGLDFPWLWYLALPARMVCIAGAPIDVRALLRAEGCESVDTADRALLQRVAERIRVQMQGELDAHVRTHGHAPYHWPSLAAAFRAAGPRRWRLLPTAWPLQFVRHMRDRLRAPARSRWHAFWRDWDLLGFYLPLGWFFLAATRAWRRPPYGYRGLSRHDARERQGQFLWSLQERPLPPREPPVAVEPRTPRAGTAPPTPVATR
ncbi:MAG: 1-acyl-sn-glycerol-3-phosphate acyltransferase [Gemmatimonadaceae bacterium]|nr:1-acyl-sn-glycerol-3-phosphate acyltransferase [Gemmatimonadaceae bacterium]